MRIEHENTFRKALTGGINLFLGAGFSVLAQGADRKPLPVGGQLADELVSEFGVQNLSKLNLPQICQVLAASQKGELRDFLRRRFTVDSYDKCYDALLSVNAPAILTTNIDNLVPRIFERSKNRYIRDITQSGVSVADKAAVHYAPLHGSVLQGEHFVFTAQDIAQAFSSDHDKWHFFTQMLQQRPTLFWGCSLDDAGVLNALHPDTVKGREHKQKWILLPDKDPGRDAYFKSMECSIIRGDTREMLDYMAEHAHGLRPHPPTVKTSVLFPQEAVPTAMPVDAPRRPLTEFFLGDEPSWDDIFSGRLYQLSHYARIVEHINSGANTLVMGIPASGKTTLLMQIATGISFSGHKLILRSPSLAKVEMILRKLNGAKALCFVDNFADYSESFSALAKAANVVAVGFDRDYNYEISAHRFGAPKFKKINITELSAVDIQNMFDTIPEGLRRAELIHPQTQEGLPPALYEIVDANVAAQGLAARYEDALRQIRKADTMLHDLLVMCGYVQSCRTPVSYDMIYAFLREKISHWSDVKQIVSKLGNMVTEHTEHTLQKVDADQDLFSLRSSIVAKAIMSKVASEDLRRVLRQFHTQVSPFRICNYDIFKRGAYDAKIIGGAFPNVNEGKDFYKKIRERDDSPYSLQQGALYLFHKGQKNDAFDWVDQANAETGGRVHSIRNTYAVILFGVNIHSQGDPERKAQTLKQCMDILSECYHSGKRKAYHAVTFAKQALMYYDVYKDTVAVEYLHTAKRWLQAENKQAPWLRNVRHWLKRVSSALDRAARKK